MDTIRVQSRVAEFDFLMPTDQFLNVLPELGPWLQVVQLRDKPPNDLEMSRLRGRELYRILGECGWFLQFETPGNDHGHVASPSRELVERAIHINQRAV